jgi:DNA modification methylase
MLNDYNQIDFENDSITVIRAKLEAIAKALNNSSKQEDIILDVFGGSGSTLIACEQLNRKCYMMELDPYYCQVIINRWEQYTGEKATKIN